MHCVDDVWIALLEMAVQPLGDYCRPVSVASVKGLERHIMALGLAYKFPQISRQFSQNKVRLALACEDLISIQGRAEICNPLDLGPC
jgi:hypothetical protein